MVHRIREKILTMSFSTKKTNLSESVSENEASVFPRFIVLEFLEEIYLAKLSPFLIEKIILSRATQRTVKKTRNGNLLAEVVSWRHAENTLKMKTFHARK